MKFLLDTHVFLWYLLGDANLPLHHRDPFDRILVAQAMNHSLVLISRDGAFDAYQIQRLWS